MTDNITKSCPVTGPDRYSAKMLDPDRIRILNTVQKRLQIRPKLIQIRPVRYRLSGLGSLLFCFSIYKEPEVGWRGLCLGGVGGG
jgi:hypothetical protein